MSVRHSQYRSQSEYLGTPGERERELQALTRYDKANRRAGAAHANAASRGTLAAASAARRAHLYAAKVARNRWIDGKWARSHEDAASYWWKVERALKKKIRALKG